MYRGPVYTCDGPVYTCDGHTSWACPRCTHTTRQCAPGVHTPPASVPQVCTHHGPVCPRCAHTTGQCAPGVHTPRASVPQVCTHHGPVCPRCVHTHTPWACSVHTTPVLTTQGGGGSSSVTWSRALNYLPSSPSPSPFLSLNTKAQMAQEKKQKAELAYKAWLERASRSTPQPPPPHARRRLVVPLASPPSFCNPRPWVGPLDD